MLSRNMNKLSIFLIIVILANVARGQTITESWTTEEVETSTATTLETIIETVNPTQTTQNDDSVTVTTTDKIECVCDCFANGNQVETECKTKNPEENQTESSTEPENDENNERTTAKSGDVTTESSIDETSSTVANTESDNTSTTTAAETTTSETEGISTTAVPTTTSSASVVCSTPAELQPHESDCQQYYECSSEGSQDGSFHLLAKHCPEKQAFNVELNRCSRDISSCLLPVQCTLKGGVADPTSNSSYYLCEPRLIGVGFRVFHVDCASNEIFYPELGKCFVDLNNIPTQSFPPFNWNQIRDIDIVKAELKLLKQQDKLKLKQEKDRKKAEEKLKKELEKEAKKQAKEQEKANKEKVKQESARFVCEIEGNFPSSVSNSTYIACVTKKGKLKALAMQCGFGATFNAETGVCDNGPAFVNNNSLSVEDDDD